MSRRRGFTLLEVLLAAVLMAVLMTGIWGLMRTYERLFSSGQAKAERAQLVRTLLEQLCDDLHSAIPDSATAMPGTSTAVRRFGLFGTQRALQVDVLQVTPAQCVAASTARDELGASPAKSPQVPELHTVQYWLEEPLLDGADGSAGARGLVRRELDWETPPGAVEEGSPRTRKTAAESLSESAALSDLASTPDPMSMAPHMADPEDPSLLWAAEVIDLQFRYYDGAAWSTEWNSLERKSLPVAIEVTLKVESGEEGRPRATARPSEDLLEELAIDQGTPGEQAGQTYRLLVSLPSTGLARPAKKADESLPSILDEAEVPLLPEYCAAAAIGTPPAAARARSRGRRTQVAGRNAARPMDPNRTTVGQGSGFRVQGLGPATRHPPPATRHPVTPSPRRRAARHGADRRRCGRGHAQPGGAELRGHDAHREQGRPYPGKPTPVGARGGLGGRADKGFLRAVLGIAGGGGRLVGQSGPVLRHARPRRCGGRAPRRLQRGRAKDRRRRGVRGPLRRGERVGPAESGGPCFNGNPRNPGPHTRPS